MRANQPPSQFRAPTKPGAGAKASPSPSKDNPSPEPQLDDIKRGKLRASALLKQVICDAVYLEQEQLLFSRRVYIVVHVIISTERG